MIENEEGTDPAPAAGSNVARPSWYKSTPEYKRSLARVPMPDPPENDEQRVGKVAAKKIRVTYVTRLLLANKPIVAQEIADYFGVAPSTVNLDVSEARKRIELIELDDDQLRLELHLGLASARERMEELMHSKEVTPGNQIKAAEAFTGIAETIAKLKGVAAPQKIDLTQGVSLEQLEEMRAVARANKDRSEGAILTRADEVEERALPEKAAE